MSKVLRDAGNGRELILTNDKVNPFGVRLDGTVVAQSWSRIFWMTMHSSRQRDAS